MDYQKSLGLVVRMYQVDLQELIAYKKREKKKLLREFDLSHNGDIWDLSLKMDRTITKTEEQLQSLNDISSNLKAN